MRRVSCLFAISIAALVAACSGGRQSLPPRTGAAVRTLSAPGTYAGTVLSLGPAQYFQLNDAAGSTAVDSSVTATNGTYIGAVSFGVPGPLLDETGSAAIALAGGTSSIGVSLPNPNAASGTSYTISTWVYAAGGASYTTIWGSSGTRRLLLTSGGQLLSQFNGNFLSKATLATGQWHDVVFVYNAATATEAYYIDGALDSSAPLSASAAAFTSPYYLGQYNTSVYYKWNGSLAQHAFFHSALSATQIATLYTAAGYGATPTPSPTPSATPTPSNFTSTVLSDNPTQYFQLNEAAGQAAVDSSTKATNGSYVGSVTFGASGPLTNAASTAISLPGGSASVGVSLPNPNAGTGASYSIETWVFPLPASSYMTIWGYSGTHRLLLTSNGQLLTQFSGNFTSLGALTFGRWHDVVFTYNAQTATAAYYIDGALDSSASLSASAAAFTSPYYLGQYDTGVYYKWRGSLAQHAFFPSALSAAQVSALYAAAGYGSASPSPPPPAYSDWATFGDGLTRSSYNPNETTLSAATAPAMHFSWSAYLGAAVDAQPVVATNVQTKTGTQTLLYIGAENGMFYALNADTGAVVWSQQLGAVSTACMDLPGGKFGITGTATFNKSANVVYVADGKDNVYALNMQTGATYAGWPVNIDNQFTANHIYGALTLNPSNGMLYVSTGSFCDHSTWNGHITAINTNTASVVATLFPATPYTGAGVWGMGGAAVDSANDLYIGTGNNETGPVETAAYGDHLVQLDQNLNVLSADSDSVSGDDIDFGATPMLFAPPGCPPLVALKGKAGVFALWKTSSIGSVMPQSLVMGPNTSAGQFIGVTAYSPVSNLVYVGVPGGTSTFTHGLVAFAPQSNCTLALAWQQTLGNADPANVADNDTPAVANGVVYFADGKFDTLYAFDASSGQQLWSSGITIGGPILSAPTVDGRVFIGSWDGNLYAFGL